MQKKEKADTRELWLLIDTPSFASVIQCNKDDGNKARQFAAKIVTAARNAPRVAEARSAAIEQAERELARAREDTAAIEVARVNLSRGEANTAAVDQARAVLDQSEREQNELDAARGALATLEQERL